MKRTDIRAGVVYAVKSSYGPPAPIVFLEDGAAGLYGRGNYGRGTPRKLEENSYTKAKRGSGFSDSTRGYPAMERAGVGVTTYDGAAELMSAADPRVELARFLADESPSADGLRFVIINRKVAVVRDGVLSNHGHEGKRCPGSGNPPKAARKEGR